MNTNPPALANPPPSALRAAFRPLFSVLCILIAAAFALQANAAVTRVVAESDQSLYLTDDGTLWAMGNNYYGQLGDGTTTYRYTPVQVAIDVITMTVGQYHSLFVKSDGSLWAAGSNSYGQLGAKYANQGTPVQVTTGVSAVAVGAYHSLFIKSDGTLWGMGLNGDGQLGDGAAWNQTTPVQIDSDVIAVSAGYNYSLFVKSDGSLWAMGANDYGQLGDGTTTKRSTPTQVATDVLAVTAMSTSSLFMKKNGTLWGMGNNSSGQLLDGTTTDRSTPLQIATDDIAVAAGGRLFVKKDGTLWALGKNNFGQLGDGTTTNRSTLVQITTDVIAVAAGNNHSLFLKKDGTLWGMGLNQSGQLGLGGDPNPLMKRTTPTYITGGHAPAITAQPDSQTIVAGQSATFVIAANGAPEPTMQWQTLLPTGSIWMNISNNGSYAGVTSATLTVTATAAIPDIGVVGGASGYLIIYSTYSPPIATLNGSQYRCVVTNPVGSGTSSAATLTVNYEEPAITAQPVSQTVNAGQNATFVIAATGLPAPTLQWQSAPSGGNIWTDISGATSATLTLSNATAAMNGTRYRCVATNAVGRIASNIAILGVAPDSATAAAQQLKLQLETSGTATITVAGAVDLALVGGATLASTKTIVGADADSTITGGLVLTTSASNTIIFGVTFNGGTLDIIGAADVTVTNCTFIDTPISISGSADNVAFAWNRFTATDTPGRAGNGSAMRINNAGTPINILLHDNLWDATLRSDMPAVTDACVLMCNNYITATDNDTATIAGAGAQILSQNNIYQGTHNPLLAQNGGLLCARGNFMAATTGTTAAGNNKVFAPSYSYTMLPSGIDTPGADTLATLITAHAGNTHGQLSFTPSKPASASIRITGSVSMPDVSHLISQLYGGGLSGSFSYSGVLTLGRYGEYGVTSIDPFNITPAVTYPGAIKPTPTGTNMLVGGGCLLTADATGASNSATWQWYHDNLPIPGATGSTHAITHATTADAGAYTVTLTTANDIVTAGAFKVTVDTFGIVIHPFSQAIQPGDSATFVVIAIGDNLTYQWRKNGVNISGATSASYTITNARQTDAGNYTVVVSATDGSVTSNSAWLTVGGAIANSGDDGSDGGGAPSLWYLGALASFALLRLLKHTRHRQM